MKKYKVLLLPGFCVVGLFGQPLYYVKEKSDSTILVKGIKDTV